MRNAKNDEDKWTDIYIAFLSLTEGTTPALVEIFIPLV